jgi:hypothetical protein
MIRDTINMTFYTRLLHNFCYRLFTYRYKHFWSRIESLQAFQKFLYASLLCSTKSFLRYYHYVGQQQRITTTGVGLYTFIWSMSPFPPFWTQTRADPNLAPPHSLRLARQLLLKHPVFVLSASSLFSLAPDCLLTVAEKFNIFLWHSCRSSTVYGPSILHLVTAKVINQDSGGFLDSYGCCHDSVFQDVTSWVLLSG